MILSGHKASEETLAAVTLTRPVSRLPQPRVNLIGREDDLERSVKLLQQSATRLMTLTGPAGVGKTVFALALAEALEADFRDGAYFIDLSLVRDSGGLLSAVSRMLGIDATTANVELALRDRLLNCELLLVLDNLEQIPDVGSAVAVMLNAGSELRVLATSRQALRLRVEQRFPLRPLGGVPTDSPFEDIQRSASVALFLERAREADPSHQLTADNASDIVRLCARLDGLPLALELAASRSDALSAGAILAHLEARGGVPWRGTVDGPDRHRSLQSALDWSVDLLQDSFKALYSRIAVFAGTFDAEAAFAVADLAALGLESLSALAELSDCNLLVPVSEAERTRFRMLVTVRDDALERLSLSGEREELRRRHADYYLALGERLCFQSERDPLAARRFDAEGDNIDEALSWALEQPFSAEHAEFTVRLTLMRKAHWRLRGGMSQMWRWCEAVLGRILQSEVGADSDSQRDDHRHAERKARLMMAMATAAMSQGEFQTAQDLLTPALHLLRSQPSSELLGVALLSYANLFNSRGKVVEATAAITEGLGIIRSYPSSTQLAGALATLASVTLDQGDPVAAAVHVREGLEVARVSGDLLMVARMLGFLGALTYFQGHAADAIAPLREALELQVAHGDAMTVGQTAANLGDALFAVGDLENAKDSFEQSIAALRHTKSLRNLPDVTTSLSMLNLQLGQTSTAATGLLEVIEQPGIHPRQTSNALCALAQVAVVVREPELAVALLGAAERVLEPHDMVFLAGPKAVCDEVLGNVRDALGTDAISASWARGGREALSELLQMLRAADFAHRITEHNPVLRDAPEPNSVTSAAAHGLSDRELEVLRLVARGLSNKEVARELQVSPHTVKFHLTAVFNKLGCSSRAEAARLSVERGLI